MSILHHSPTKHVAGLLGVVVAVSNGKLEKDFDMSSPGCGIGALWELRPGGIVRICNKRLSSPGVRCVNTVTFCGLIQWSCDSI